MRTLVVSLLLLLGAGSLRAGDAFDLRPVFRVDLAAILGHGLVAIHALDDLVLLESDDARVTAFEPATGSLRWTAALPGPLERRPIAADGRVTLSSGAHVLVVDARTGARLLDRELDVLPAATPVATAHTLVVPSLLDDSVVAYDAGGSLELWRIPLRARIDASDAFVELGEHDGLLLGDATGRLRLLPVTPAVPRGERWSVTLPQLAGRPLVADARVFVVDTRRTVTALDAASGARRWSRVLDDDLDATPVLVGRRLVVSTAHGLTALDADDGAPLWTQRAEERPVGALGDAHLLTKRPGGERALRRASDGALVEAEIGAGAVTVGDVLVEWTDRLVSGRRLVAR